MDDAPPSIEPYEVLGLERDVSADDIKKAYRKAALKHHPGEQSSASLLADLQLPFHSADAPTYIH